MYSRLHEKQKQKNLSPRGDALKDLPTGIEEAHYKGTYSFLHCCIFSQRKNSAWHIVYAQEKLHCE